MPPPGLDDQDECVRGWPAAILTIVVITPTEWIVGRILCLRYHLRIQFEQSQKLNKFFSRIRTWRMDVQAHRRHRPSRRELPLGRADTPTHTTLW